MDNKTEQKLHAKLENQQYGFTGKHSAVKICTWAKKSLRGEGVCYKESFYGIRSQLCCQMTPTIGYCQNKCIFCWREVDLTLGNDMKNLKEIDEPEEIIKNSIIQQRKLISGFGGNEKVDLYNGYVFLFKIFLWYSVKDVKNNSISTSLGLMKY